MNKMTVVFAPNVAKKHGEEIDPNTHHAIGRAVKMIDEGAGIEFENTSFSITTEKVWDDTMRKSFGKTCKNISSKLSERVINNSLFKFVS